jgi:hypothetical protein
MILPIEQETYGKVNDYRQQLRTSALTSLDVLKFAATCSMYDINPEVILKHIIIGNTCSWATYEIACYYEKYKNSFRFW